jgi:threonine dehydratase
MMKPPTIEDIRAAAKRIEGSVVRTPMLMSRTLSRMVGAEVWLKFENLQLTSAYKERGALNKLLQLSDEERGRGVIAASAGNHAQAVAYHARRLGIPATIVMPSSTPTVKVSQTESHGARVVLHGEMFDDAYARRARSRRPTASYSSTRSMIRRLLPAKVRWRSRCLRKRPISTCCAYRSEAAA